MAPPSLFFLPARMKAVASFCSRVALRQHVAGQLPGDELVVGDVALEGRDHPVAVGVGNRLLVVVQAAARVSA